jgi:hypothetical protein
MPADPLEVDAQQTRDVQTTLLRSVAGTGCRAASKDPGERAWPVAGHLAGLMDPDRGSLDGTEPVAAPYDGAIAGCHARTDSDGHMKNWQLELVADLVVAIGFAIFMSLFIGSAVSAIFGSTVGLMIGAIAGILTFFGGARIAFRIAHGLRDLPPTPRPDPQIADPADQPDWDGSPSPKWEREPLLTDVMFVFVGLGVIAVGYGWQFNAIKYRPGDIRATPEFDAAMLTIAVVGGLFFIVVGSIRLVQGLRRRRP